MSCLSRFDLLDRTKPHPIMSRAAKATLLTSVLLSGLTVWGVHFMQVQEREVCSNPTFNLR